MTYAIVWDERAVSIASRFLTDDADGLTFLMDAVDLLADEPWPTGSFPYANEDLRRMHIGRYRILYEIDPKTQTITIVHVGRTA